MGVWTGLAQRRGGAMSRLFLQFGRLISSAATLLVASCGPQIIEADFKPLPMNTEEIQIRKESIEKGSIFTVVRRVSNSSSRLAFHSFVDESTYIIASETGEYYIVSGNSDTISAKFSSGGRGTRISSFSGNPCYLFIGTDVIKYKDIRNGTNCRDSFNFGSFKKIEGDVVVIAEQSHDMIGLHNNKDFKSRFINMASGKVFFETQHSSHKWKRPLHFVASGDGDIVAATGYKSLSLMRVTTGELLEFVDEEGIRNSEAIEVANAAKIGFVAGLGLGVLGRAVAEKILPSYGRAIVSSDGKYLAFYNYGDMAIEVSEISTKGTPLAIKSIYKYKTKSDTSIGYNFFRENPGNLFFHSDKKLGVINIERKQATELYAFPNETGWEISSCVYDPRKNVVWCGHMDRTFSKLQL